jgi:hypothetical protein
MLTALIITLLIVAALAYGLRAERRGEMIIRHPYNNRYNDASAAREDHPEL